MRITIKSNQAVSFSFHLYQGRCCLRRSLAHACSWPIASLIVIRCPTRSATRPTSLWPTQNARGSAAQPQPRRQRQQSNQSSGQKTSYAPILRLAHLADAPSRRLAAIAKSAQRRVAGAPRKSLTDPASAASRQQITTAAFTSCRLAASASRFDQGRLSPCPSRSYDSPPSAL